MVALLLGVVVVVCHTPKTFINLYESYHMLRYGKMTAEPLWSKIIIKLSHLLLSLSSAVNIIIYSAKVTNYLYCIPYHPCRTSSSGPCSQSASEGLAWYPGLLGRNH